MQKGLRFVFQGHSVKFRCFCHIVLAVCIRLLELQSVVAFHRCEHLGETRTVSIASSATTNNGH